MEMQIFFNINFCHEWEIFNNKNHKSRRHNLLNEWMQRIEDSEGGIDHFSQGYRYYGLHFEPDNSVIAREWAPGAQALYLTGDFNGWQWEATPFKKMPFGKWELYLPPREDGSCPIYHLSEVKVIVRNQHGQLLDRLSPWAKYVVQPAKHLNQGVTYKQYVWHPPPHEKYIFKHKRPIAPRSSLKIYECHVGIATDKLEVGNYRNFADNVIPRIVRQGYNAIQVMAIMEVNIFVLLMNVLSFTFHDNDANVILK